MHILFERKRKVFIILEGGGVLAGEPTIFRGSKERKGIYCLKGKERYLLFGRGVGC